MTKSELVALIAKDCKISKAVSERALNSVTANVTKCLKKKDKLTLTGFGTFLVSKRRARKGRNPQTGAEIEIRAANVPKFRAGKELRKACQ
ncbi:MAG: HU family DNA-binding protein [Deltaproteobacteria bacterium]|nr:HU family DNA-binding protein [Deltaproteobacteria bacterium]MBI4197226.1 HU family DNA-binding protein [Deltaproteobacteria bacterium]